ncbi:hypothetical protein MFLAVUS_008642 [Mucor flavus]|uniref:Uncharacterized protein n=1 Tax=Mucor flavus TaxID=439312 RepID=A0ABP9Z7N4_9FUNG
MAMNYRVTVYTLDTIFSPFKEATKVLVSPHARQIGGGSESPFIINSIKVGRLLEKEVLVTVSENGEICIWRTENLDEPPLVINNEEATWGIAIHADQGLIAVSANNWIISVYNILEMTKSDPIFGSRKRHENNIPNIDFNETGQYIASASIDQTCRIWDITTKQVVTQTKTVDRRDTPHDSWCWSVKFIKPGHFMYAACTDNIVGKAFMQRIYQGRSTSLNNLGICHSAVRPVFPVNVSSMYDLEEEEIDFSIYEMGDADDIVWDNSLLQEEEDFMEEVFERQRQEDDYTYNHGEIPSRILNNTRSSDSETELPVTEYSNTESIDGVIRHELAFENAVNQRLREINQEPDEPIQQSNESNANNDSLESIEQEDYFGDAVENDRTEYELWTGSNRIPPSQMGWSPAIINLEGERVTGQGDNAAIVESIRDGWGDEIVSEMQNSSIDESMSTAENHADSNSDQSNSDEVSTSSISRSPSYCIPNVVRSRDTGKIEELDRSGIELPSNTLGEYLMISTGKDVAMMSTSKPKMGRIRAEHNIINKVDVRSDQLLSVLDRINMVEWLPELELYVAASQKGTVALMRVLQVEFEGGDQACMFNNEYYLPTSVLQSTPLYGMTVKKVESERFSPVTYQIFLFYYSGNVLGYTISRNDSDLLVENFIL